VLLRTAGYTGVSTKSEKDVGHPPSCYKQYGHRKMCWRRQQHLLARRWVNVASEALVQPFSPENSLCFFPNRTFWCCLTPLRLSCKNHRVEPSHRRFPAFENASAAIKVQNVLLSAVLPVFLPLTLISVTPMVMRMMPPWLEIVNNSAAGPVKVLVQGQETAGL